MVLSVTATEKRVLQSLHLQGHMGKMGSIKLTDILSKEGKYKNGKYKNIFF